MGFECCGELFHNDHSVLVDLPPISTRGLKDKYQIWEYGTAFKRTLFLAFKMCVQAAHEDCGEEGFVTLEALSEHLNTEVWRGLRDP